MHTKCPSKRTQATRYPVQGTSPALSREPGAPACQMNPHSAAHTAQTMETVQEGPGTSAPPTCITNKCCHKRLDDIQAMLSGSCNHSTRQSFSNHALSQAQRGPQKAAPRAQMHGPHNRADRCCKCTQPYPGPKAAKRQANTNALLAGAPLLAARQHVHGHSRWYPTQQARLFPTSVGCADTQHNTG